jgi:hypothetical protein
MTKKLDLDELLRRNPHVDQGKLQEGRELAEKLREAGVKGKGYHLASPGEHRKAQVVDTKGERNAVHLRNATP